MDSFRNFKLHSDFINFSIGKENITESGFDLILTARSKEFRMGVPVRTEQCQVLLWVSKLQIVFTPESCTIPEKYWVVTKSQPFFKDYEITETKEKEVGEQHKKTIGIEGKKPSLNFKGDNNNKRKDITELKHIIREYFIHSFGNKKRAGWEFIAEESKPVLKLEITDEKWAYVELDNGVAEIAAHARITKDNLHCSWIEPPKKAWSKFKNEHHDKFSKEYLWRRLEELNLAPFETTGAQVLIPWTESITIQEEARTN